MILSPVTETADGRLMMLWLKHFPWLASQTIRMLSL